MTNESPRWMEEGHMTNTRKSAALRSHPNTAVHRIYLIRAN